MMTGKQLVENAIAGVESPSIREWANTPHNRPLFDKIADGWVKAGKADVSLFTAYIVCQAIGL